MHARAIPANAATPSTATISAIAAAMPAIGQAASWGLHF